MPAWCAIAYLVMLALPFVLAGTVLTLIAVVVARVLDYIDRKRVGPPSD